MNEAVPATTMKRLAGIALYSIGLLLFLEIVFRVLLSSWTIFHAIKGWDDASARIDWVQGHVEHGALIYQFYAYHPSRGWSLIPSIKDMTVFGNRLLNSNSMAVRGTTEYTYARQTGKRRILVFGDSYTFGDEVSDTETYAHYLERILPDTEVINLGVHGYGHDQMLLYLKEEGVKYQPDIVILGFVALDMNRNLFSFNNYAKPKFEVRDNAVHLTNPFIPSPEWFIENERYQSKLIDTAVILREKIRWTVGMNEVRSEHITSEILKEFAQTVREMNAAPAFVYLPVLSELNNLDESKTSNEQYLLSQCEDQRVPCLFLRPSFIDEHRKGATFNTRSHWMAQEHLIAAHAMGKFLSEDQFPMHGGVRTSSLASPTRSASAP